MQASVDAPATTSRPADAPVREHLLEAGLLEGVAPAFGHLRLGPGPHQLGHVLRFLGTLLGPFAAAAGPNPVALALDHMVYFPRHT